MRDRKKIEIEIEMTSDELVEIEETLDELNHEKRKLTAFMSFLQDELKESNAASNQT